MKEDIKKRIGRSPDDGDAVIIACCTGSKRVQPRLRDRNDYMTKTHATTSRSTIRRPYR